MLDIYDDFIDHVNLIVKRYQNKVATIINGLRSEEDQNKLLEQLEVVHHGMNFRNASAILQRWEKEINE